MNEHLKVIYSSNFKGNLEFAAKTGSLIKEARIKYELCIVLNGGNTSWGTDETNYFKGEPMWKAIKEIGYDGVTLGPMDFLHGWKNLREYVPSIKVPATICNLFNTETDNRVKSIPPYLIVKKTPGLKVGLLGAIDENIEFENENKVFLDYADTSLLWAVNMLKKEQCNYIVAMAYMSLDRCMEMTQKVSGMDLIICTDSSQDEISEIFTFHNCIVSCENTKGGKLAIIDVEK